MKKKEIIIITVLVNAGLLFVLFTSALHSDRDEPSIVMETQLTSSPNLPPPTPVLQTKSEDVDPILSQFAAATSPVSIPDSPLLRAEPEHRLALSRTSPSINLFEGAPSVEEFTEIKVKKGDMLEKIARTHGVPVKTIIQINNLTSTQLKIGQILKIPSKSSSNTNRQDPSAYRLYTVKSGENLWTIAIKNHMTLDELLQLNHLDEKEARKLKPGDQLKIR
jgi:LysM repeat protein